MFERYTEKARRVIFFARYEASQYGSPNIESEHLLLGILREDKALTNRFLRSVSFESIRKQIDSQTTVREKTSTSVDLPLSNESKRVLAYAAEEAERLGDKHIGTEHLLLGLLREEKCLAAELLKERDVRQDWVRDELAKNPQPATTRPLEPAALPEPFRDLAQEAIDGELDSVVNRDAEIECVIEILGSQRRRNPILIGERGAGKTAIVKGLAQRIADGAVPAFLAEKRILVVEPEMIVAWARDRQEPEGLARLIRTKSASSDVILFLDGLQGFVRPLPDSGAPDTSGLFRYAVARCATVYRRRDCGCLQGDYPGDSVARRKLPHVHVLPLDEIATLKVLLARKSRLEKFHGVQYVDDALEFAAHSSGKYLPERPLPAKALELLDAAGSLVKLRQAAAVPEEVKEIQRRIKFIVQRMENSIANHEFEKARFYSMEEKKELESLRILRETHKLDDSALGVVGLKDVEEVVARWATYPYRPSKE
jgi:ATP-dependent Clp protease ATP-binding subunit ClpC